MLAVILAAGVGGRLGDLTGAVPKPLVPLNGRPLLDYTLDSLAAAGVRRAVVVTGYRGMQVREAFARDGNGRGVPLVSFASNPRFREPASLSLHAAREATGESPFLVLMADHLLSPGVIRALAGARNAAPDAAACFVAADFTPHAHAYADEATKLRVGPAGGVTAIGKGLPRWDALDCGAFLLSPAAWDVFAEMPEACELSVLFGALADRGLLYAADIGGAFWYDVDTPEDLAAAARALAFEPAAT